jgi:hypothetical protein
LIYILFWTCCQRIVGADESHLESPASIITFVHSIYICGIWYMYIYIWKAKLYAAYTY